VKRGPLDGAPTHTKPSRNMPKGNSSGFLSSLRYADLRWLWAVAIAIALYGAYWLLKPDIDQALRDECRRRYAAARTASDSAAVDEEAPFSENPKFRARQPSCGDVRRLGQVP